MGLISFTCANPVASWWPTVNPKYGGGYQRSKERYQPKEFSDGGDVYSYSHGEKDGRTLEWGILPDADMTTLLTFLAAMKGGRYTFTITDYDSFPLYGCRVLNYEAFPFKNRLSLYYEIILDLEVATEKLIGVESLLISEASLSLILSQVKISVSETLTFAEVTPLIHVLNITAAENLAFEEVVSVLALIRIPAADNLAFAEVTPTVVLGSIKLTVSENLSFAEITPTIQVT